VESLALRYRPRQFADVSGQTASVAILYQMCMRDRMPVASLLHGCRGSGKTSTARITAAAMNCKADPGPPDRWPCLECPSCRAIGDGSSLDVIEVDAASNGGVAEVQRLREDLMYSSSGARRVVLLDEAHSMSRNAFNALLKVLEEPPPGVAFILLTTDPSKILYTVASRCIRFPFRRLTPQLIAARLAWICRQEDIPAQDSLLLAIAEQADGAMRDAVNTLDQLSSVGIHDLARYLMLTGDTDYAPRLIDAMVLGDHALLFSRLEAVLQQDGDFAAVSARLITCLRDLLVLLGGGVLTAQGEALDARQRLAGRLDVTRVGAALRVLWDLRTRVARTTPRADLELAAVMVSERLRGPQISQTMVSVPGSGNGNGHGTPADISQLRAMTGS
jgi:DNA polymerase-3 subunit gamma/tau